MQELEPDSTTRRTAAESTKENGSSRKGREARTAFEGRIAERPRRPTEYGQRRPIAEYERFERAPTREWPTGSRTVRPIARREPEMEYEIPSMDLYEGAEEFSMVVDLPGFETEEIELQVTAETVRIVAERDADDFDDGWLVERQRPDVLARTVDLPAKVSVEDVEATYEDGVARVVLPKAAGQGGRIVDFEG